MKGINITLPAVAFSFLFSSTVFAIEVKTPQPVSGRNPFSTKHIIPADVYARVKLLSAELDLVRLAMGKPKEKQMVLSVSNASPREVYFQADSLFVKANRLAYEVRGHLGTKPKLVNKNIAPAHVWQLVDASLKQILKVKMRLGIKKQAQELMQPNDRTPTDVFNALLQANQQLNILLQQPFSPSDAYQQLTRAINYTEQLLKRYNVDERIPKAPALVMNKTPEDVFKRLTQCIEIIESIAKRSDIRMLDINVNQINLHQVTPSNVYDLASIIVSEVQYFGTKQKNFEVIESFYPGYKTSSQVFQRSAILLEQLKQLEVQVSKIPLKLSNNIKKVEDN